MVTIRRDGMEFEGAPLPRWLGERFQVEGSGRALNDV
jgi:hypothetical protein